MNKIDTINSLRVLFSLVALFATVSINAQAVKIYKNGSTEPIAVYINTSTDKYKVVLKEGDYNLLKAQYSVSDTKKVQFTKGNLQATYNSTTKSYTWGIAANQYDYVGNNPGNTTIGNSQTDGSVVDLFGWSTGATYYGINTSTNYIYSGDFKDWSGALVSEGREHYYTLSKDEWVYLLNISNDTSGARTNTNRFAKAKINGVKGLLIFPDNYNGTTVVTGTGIATVNAINVSYPSESISDDTWSAMHSAGVVFLPAACNRNGSGIGSDNYGCYWSSTGNSKSYAYYLTFDKDSNDSVNPSRIGFRYYGFSVRLVADVNE